MRRSDALVADSYHHFGTKKSGAKLMPMEAGERASTGCWPGEESLDELPIGRLFGIASRLVGLQWWRLVERSGLSVTGMWTLLALAREDGLTSREVAARTWCSPATMTGVADTLERDGYIERCRDGEDRRIVRLHLTGTGKAALEEVQTRLSQDLGSLFDYIYPADEPAVRRFLIDTVHRFGPLVRCDETRSGV